MLKKGSNKALSHVDWAMSLGIFLLYLAWFFIFVKPLFSPAQNMDVLLDILESGVESSIFENIERVRIFVPGSFDNEFAPIIIPFDYDWSVSGIAHTADHFVVDDGRMFFLGNLSETSTFTMYYPHTALEFTPLNRVLADETAAWSDFFSADFDDYLLDSIFFRGETRLIDFSVEVDESGLDETGSFENSTFFAKYSRFTDSVNLSSYFFSKNSEIHSYLESADYDEHSVAVDFAVYNYTSFYFDPSSNGDFNYGINPSCRYYTGDFLDLYEADSGLLVTVDHEASFRLCVNETNAFVRIEFDIVPGEEYNFDIILHTGDVDSVLGYPIEPIVGVTETLRLLSPRKISLLRNRDYDYLKQLFNYPKDRNFNMTVTSDIISSSYGIEQPLLEDVYARKIEGIILDEYYNYNRAFMTLTVW